MIYNFIIALYTSAVRLAALFNKKVALMVKGEKEAFGILEKQIVRGEKYLWFHAASLGEFEQGRPLIEEIRKNIHNTRFFRPSSRLPDTRYGRITREQTSSAIFRSTHRVM